MRFFERIAAAALLALLLGALPAGAAQVLYKWVDANGKTQYSDQPPKSFRGEVQRIDADEQPVAAEPYKPPIPAAKRAADSPAAEDDAAGKRRELRQRLSAAVASARARLAVAKAALESAGGPQDDERQIVQQRVQKDRPTPGDGSASTGGMLGMGGMLGGAPRSNCTTVKNADGGVVTTCPTGVPSDAYYEGIQKLEDDVRSAEEELAAAERAYRRGVD